jgi:predicted kinase
LGLFSYLKSTVPQEHTALSERERQAIEQVAQQRGVTFEEALEQMAKEGLASRVRRKTGRAPAKVYQIPPRRSP